MLVTCTYVYDVYIVMRIQVHAACIYLYIQISRAILCMYVKNNTLYIYTNTDQCKVDILNISENPVINTL